MKYNKLIYYYSDNCTCCKDYKDVVDKISSELQIDTAYINIDKGITRHHLEGIPTLVIENDNATVLYKSVGNIQYDLIIKDIKDKLGYDK